MKKLFASGTFKSVIFCLAAIAISIAPAYSQTAVETKAVLFDNFHLESIGNANWTITGGYSDFADSIRAMGYRVDEIKNASVSVSLLKKYDAFVIAEPNLKFSSDEESAIVEYVKGGGGLFLIADHQGADRNNDGWDAVRIFNSFSQNFGMKFAEKWIKKEMPIKGKFEQNDLTYKVKYCGTWGGTTIELLNAQAKGHIFVSDQNGGGAYFATSEVDKGRVAAMGDSSPFDDGTGDKGAVDLTDGYNLLDCDHRQLAVNAMCYILKKNPADFPIKVKFYYEGGKLNAKAGEAKEFPLTLSNQSSKDISDITIDFYRNRPFDEKTKFNSIKVDRIAAGEKVQVKLPFKRDERMMFVLYTCVSCGSDKTANIVGFNSIMIGVPIMFYVDSVHENDYVNRIKMLKSAFEEEGIFFTRSKNPLDDYNLAKVDVVAISAPKKGFLPKPEEIVSLMNHLKKGRGLMLIAKGPDSQWGDNENLNELLKGLGIPAKFVAHPEFTSNGGKAVTYEITENPFIKLEGGKTIQGESPSAVEIDQNALKASGAQCQVMTTLPGSKVPVGVIIDYSKSNLGFGKVALFGAFHLSDQSYQMNLESPTNLFNMRMARVLSPAEPAFASTAPAGQQSGKFIRGIAKAYANGTLFVEDFGVSKEIKILHGLSEEKALVEFAKIKGKLVKVNLRPDVSEPTIDSFAAIECKGSSGK